jgi:hypothetical protein
VFRRFVVLTVAALAVAAAAATGAGSTGSEDTAVTPATTPGFSARYRPEIRDEAAMVLVGTALIGLAAAVRHTSE